MSDWEQAVTGNVRGGRDVLVVGADLRAARELLAVVVDALPVKPSRGTADTITYPSGATIRTASPLTIRHGAERGHHIGYALLDDDKRLPLDTYARILAPCYLPDTPHIGRYQ